ncbi:MAG: asparaginase domain-containing protein [Pseudomonadota bacterium]|nr:asparaginase domain-containing protein [Pseudomonadota bacterium]
MTIKTNAFTVNSSQIPAFFKFTRSASISLHTSQITQRTNVLLTGGTIGANPYPESKLKAGAVYPVTPPAKATMLDISPIHRALQLTCAGMDYDIEQVADCDSQDMLSDHNVHYENLLNSIRSKAALGQKKCLVTIGTDGMVQVGRKLYQDLKDDIEKYGLTILLTGSMIPLSNGVVSDGFRNLERAASRLQHAKPSVYVSMENLFDMSDKFHIGKDRSNPDQKYLISFV